MGVAGFHPQAGGMGVDIRALSVADRVAIAEIIAGTGAFSDEEARVALDLLRVDPSRAAVEAGWVWRDFIHKLVEWA